MTDIHKGCGGYLYYFTYGNPPIGVARRYGCQGWWEKPLTPASEVDPQAEGFEAKSPRAIVGAKSGPVSV